MITKEEEDRIYWCGNPVDEMSRDEAISALKQCIRIYVGHQKQTLEQLQRMSEIRQLQRMERR